MMPRPERWSCASADFASLLLVALVAAAPQVSAQENAASGIEAERRAFVEAFAVMQAELSALDPESTSGERLRREASEAAEAFAARIADAVEQGTLHGEHLDAALDDALSLRQIAAVYRIEVGDCAEAVAALEALQRDPATRERPVLAAAVDRRLDEGRRCVEAQARADRMAQLVDRRESVALRAGIGTGAAVAALTAVALSIRSSRAADGARAERRATSRSLDGYQADRNRVRRSGIGAGVSAAAALTLGVTAALLPRGANRDRRASSSVRLAASGVEMTW